jgi:hypothetical protein
MSIRDPEVLEALREEPELLAIADAVKDTQPLPSSFRGPAVSRWVALVAVGVAALVAVLLWPSGGEKSPIIDRALAAIGDGPVLHLVVRTPTGQEVVNVNTGRTTVPTVEVETWSDRSLKRFHLLMRENGRVIGEVLFPQHRTKDMELNANDPAYAALWSGYTDALTSGKAKIMGEGSVDGHPVYWLSFGSPRDEVAVDRRTYKPVVFWSTSASGRRSDSRVLLARTEPSSASAFERRTSAPSPLEGGSSFSSGETGPVAPSNRGQPWLLAGSTIAGLKLNGVNATQTTSGRNTSNGFQLVYGSEGGFGKKSLTIDEAKRPGDPSEWKGIPDGFMRLSFGEGSDNDNRAYTIWTGNLVQNGVYVTITTSVSRAAVLEAARALRPA